MKWFNLKQNKCPKCNKDFLIYAKFYPSGSIECKCGFFITKEKMDELVAKIVGDNIDQEFLLNKKNNKYEKNNIWV